MDTNGTTTQIVYWHRDLPPVTASVLGDGEIEATSGRVAGTLANRDRLWQQCLAELMAAAGVRLEQEVSRCGGRYAHVLTETIDTKRDDRTGETWLHGKFDFVLME
ncbi:MAG: hypothetical protein ABIX28_21690 [Vicinamibacterales bacterium]